MIADNVRGPSAGAGTDPKREPTEPGLPPELFCSSFPRIVFVIFIWDFYNKDVFIQYKKIR